jgi:hypothetical protein
MASVRGMAFLGTARFIKREYGEEVLARIVEDAGVATQLTFTKRINGLALYPYEALVGLLHAVDRELGTGDLTMCRTVGDVAARQDLETIFKAYVVRDPEDMIRACAPIWGMYCEDAGRMEAVEAKPESTVLRIYDFPKMDPAHCRLMEGWMIAAMEVVGVQILPGARETECMSSGGRYHEFSCRWQLK